MRERVSGFEEFFEVGPDVWKWDWVLEGFLGPKIGGLINRPVLSPPKEKLFKDHSPYGQRTSWYALGYGWPVGWTCKQA
jgi:hypothetical protein